MKRDLVGQKFGRLEVLNLACPDPATRNRRWTCMCACGMTELVWESNLIRGHKKSCGCLHKFADGVFAQNQVLDSYRRGARKRGLCWGLSKEQALILMANPCFYCSSSPSNRASTPTGSFVYNGIDRRDNLQGYLLTNCVACCRVCNIMKQDLTVEDFLAHVHRIAAN